VQFHLTDEGKLGYMSQLSGEKGVGVMAITECHLPEGSINQLWPQLEFEPETEIERVSLRSGVEEDLMLVLESESPETPELEIEAGISITHVFEENTVVIAGNDDITIRVLDRDFRVSAASFFQVNTAMAQKMVEHLLANVPVSPASTLLDIYCGAGLFSAFFASRCERVIGIESSPSACEDFAFNLDEFENVELYEGFAEEILPSLVGGRIVPRGDAVATNPPHVIVDPPRAGLDKTVIDGILKLSPKVIAYVSCDPSTLARDAARLINGGYKLTQVTPFDLFPQTFHIESISIFEL
jgi:23S rRNA (uracil1939-C5)-methyltransferase